jgi:hypothetical protein
VPKKITKPGSAYMLISEDDNTDQIPIPTEKYVLLTSLVALATGSISASLHQVPNQPIQFKVFLYNLDFLFIYLIYSFFL